MVNDKISIADDLQIVKNVLALMPRSYNKNTINFKKVMDILLNGTSHSGSASSCDKCRELGIDPYSYELEGSKK